MSTSESEPTTTSPVPSTLSARALDVASGLGTYEERARKLQDLAIEAEEAGDEVAQNDIAGYMESIALQRIGDGAT